MNASKANTIAEKTQPSDFRDHRKMKGPKNNQSCPKSIKVSFLKVPETHKGKICGFIYKWMIDDLSPLQDFSEYWKKAHVNDRRWTNNDRQYLCIYIQSRNTNGINIYYFTIFEYPLRISVWQFIVDCKEYEFDEILQWKAVNNTLHFIDHSAVVSEK